MRTFNTTKTKFFNKIEKNILLVLEKCLFLRRSKITCGMRPLAIVAGLFYAYILKLNKPLGLWCAVAAMPARTSMLVLNNTTGPYLLTFKNNMQ